MSDFEEEEKKELERKIKKLEEDIKLGWRDYQGYCELKGRQLETGEDAAGCDLRPSEYQYLGYGAAEVFPVNAYAVGDKIGDKIYKTRAKAMNNIDPSSSKGILSVTAYMLHPGKYIYYHKIDAMDKGTELLEERLKKAKNKYYSLTGGKKEYNFYKAKNDEELEGVLEEITGDIEKIKQDEDTGVWRVIETIGKI